MSSNTTLSHGTKKAKRFKVIDFRARISYILDIRIEDILNHPDLHARVKYRPIWVERYSDKLKKGSWPFPPLIGFQQEGHNRVFLADGFHRLAAAYGADKKRVPVRVYQGDFRLAMLYSFGANAGNATEGGIPRTIHDRKVSLLKLFEDPMWRPMPNKWKAEVMNMKDVAEVSKFKKEFERITVRRAWEE